MKKKYRTFPCKTLLSPEPTSPLVTMQYGADDLNLIIYLFIFVYLLKNLY